MNLLISATVVFTTLASSVLAQSFNYSSFTFGFPFEDHELRLRSINDELRPKIVGGEDAGHVVPFQVSLQVKRRPGRRGPKGESSDWAHNCGGSILKPTVVLTAAHCVVKFSPSRLSVVVGTDNRKVGGKRYRVKSITVHSGYRELRQHDIALLHTDKIKFGPYVQPIQLQKSHVGGNEHCTLTGWGYTYPIRGGSLPEHLQTIDLPTISNDMCRKVMKQLTEGEICTYKGHLEAACGGDSGGPLVCRGKLTGIVSYGSRICGSGAPDVFTRVSEHIDWIHDNIESYGTIEGLF